MGEPLPGLKYYVMVISLFIKIYNLPYLGFWYTLLI